MSIRIVNQRDGAQACEAVRQANFCYICASGLKSGRRARGSTDDDHVIPATLFKDVACADRDKWPIKLPVHRYCHAELKNKYEDDLLNFIRAQVDLVQLDDPQKAGRVGKALKDADFMQLSGQHAAVKGIDNLFAVPRAWARGLMTALYCQRFAPDAFSHTYPPIPIFQGSPKNAAASIHRNEQLKTSISYFMDASIQADTWDGIISYGGSLAFAVAWSKCRGTVTGIWTLEHFHSPCSVYPQCLKQLMASVCVT